MSEEERAILAIWKYPLDGPMIFQTIEMPIDAQILCVQVQNSIPCIWAAVNTTNSKVKRVFVLVPTGHKFSYSQRDRMQYLGTIQTNEGQYVWHLMEIKK